MMSFLIRATTSGILLFYLDTANATEFEKLGDAIAKALGTKQVFKTTLPMGKDTVTVFYSKNKSGKAEKLGVLQTGLYEPNCTHTWIVGVDAATTKINGIRVVEMSCPHAFPTREASYLDQYKGKGPKDAAKLSSVIHTIAKATGSSNLTTTAVIKSIQAADLLKGKI